jgi:hypothetical protein
VVGLGLLVPAEADPGKGAYVHTSRRFNI